MFVIIRYIRGIKNRMRVKYEIIDGKKRIIFIKDKKSGT